MVYTGYYQIDAPASPPLQIATAGFFDSYYGYTFQTGVSAEGNVNVLVAAVDQPGPYSSPTLLAGQSQIYLTYTDTSGILGPDEGGTLNVTICETEEPPGTPQVDWTFSATQVSVPEPTTLSLLGIAAIGLLAYTLRRRRRAPQGD
jgi:hypothetical protein